MEVLFGNITCNNPFHKSFTTKGGWWHLNWGGWARGNDWSGISGMVSNTSNTWKPCVPFQPLL